MSNAHLRVVYTQRVCVCVCHGSKFVEGTEGIHVCHVPFTDHHHTSPHKLKILKVTKDKTFITCTSYTVPSPRKVPTHLYTHHIIYLFVQTYLILQRKSFYQQRSRYYQVFVFSCRVINNSNIELVHDRTFSFSIPVLWILVLIFSHWIF